MSQRFTLPVNNPNQAGSLAAPKQTFGPFGRYAVAPVHTRFDYLEWFVWDAEVIDDVTGKPVVICQEKTQEEAIAGLPH